MGRVLGLASTMRTLGSALWATALWLCTQGAALANVEDDLWYCYDRMQWAAEHRDARYYSNFIAPGMKRLSPSGQLAGAQAAFDDAARALPNSRNVVFTVVSVVLVHVDGPRHVVRVKTATYSEERDAGGRWQPVVRVVESLDVWQHTSELVPRDWQLQFSAPSAPQLDLAAAADLAPVMDPKHHDQVPPVTLARRLLKGAMDQPSQPAGNGTSKSIARDACLQQCRTKHTTCMLGGGIQNHGYSPFTNKSCVNQEAICMVGC